MLFIGTLAATTASIAPAHAEAGWRTAVTWRDARAQICTEVDADGTAVVRVRMNNRRGEAKVSAGIASVRANGKPDRSLVTTSFVGAGRTSAAVRYDKLAADDSFFVDIAHMTGEGAGIVKTSAKSFLVSAQTSC
jgi:hypothetical protein